MFSFVQIDSDAFLGFMVKVKKILECICVNCGRLKADEVSRLRLPSRFAPHLPNFLGALPATRKPQACPVYSLAPLVCESRPFKGGLRAISVA